MPVQQFVILSPEDTRRDHGLASLGSREQIIRDLAQVNTAPEKPEGNILYGPGIVIELPPTEEVTQMLMTITEEEIAWQVILRLAKRFQWRLLDPSTGREFTPAG